MRVPAMKDVLQEGEGKLEVPEIRVWCHPAKIGQSGDDYYYDFDTFPEALRFIETHQESEDAPLIAFRGYELNLWEMEPVLTEPDGDEDQDHNLHPMATRRNGDL